MRILCIERHICTENALDPESALKGFTQRVLCELISETFLGAFPCPF